MIFPVYAAILFALTLYLARSAGLGFGPRFALALGGLIVSTGISVIATIVIAGRARRRDEDSTRPRVAGRIPAWAPALLLLVTASAGAAFVSM